MAIRPNETFDDFQTHLKLIERSGFDSVWISDVGLHRETLVTCAMACLVTERLNVGPGVVNPYTRHPALIAEQIATIQEASKGRCFLGLGIGGYSALRHFGVLPWEKPIENLRQSIHIIRDLLAGKQVHSQAGLFKVDGKMDFTPERDVPIFLGVMLGAKSIRLAGELCDGGLIVGSSLPGKAKKVVDKIRESALSSGRSDASSLEMAMSFPFAISESRRGAIDKVRDAVGRLAIGDDRLRPTVLDLGVSEAEIARVKSAISKNESLSQCVSDSMVDLFAIAGNASDCIEKIDALGKVGVTQIVVGRPSREDSNMIEMIGKQIMPHFA